MLVHRSWLCTFQVFNLCLMNLSEFYLYLALLCALSIFYFRFLYAKKIRLSKFNFFFGFFILELSIFYFAFLFISVSNHYNLFIYPFFSMIYSFDSNLIILLIVLFFHYYLIFIAMIKYVDDLFKRIF